MNDNKLVIIESPYSGDIEENKKYAIECMQDSIQRGEMPFLSHLLYTQCLDDTKKDDRDLGIRMGLEWGKFASKTIVYVDRGISKGMEIGIEDAKNNKRRIEYRSLYSTENKGKEIFSIEIHDGKLHIKSYVISYQTAFGFQVSNLKESGVYSTILYGSVWDFNIERVLERAKDYYRISISNFHDMMESYLKALENIHEKDIEPLKQLCKDKSVILV